MTEPAHPGTKPPPRTFLFTPGNHPRRVEKALASDADATILDLEDAVATCEKERARHPVAAALTLPRRNLLFVRVNPADTPFCHGDLHAVIRPGLDGVILPKVESAIQLGAIDWLIAQLERERGLPPNGIQLLPLIETAQGLAHLPAITAAGTRARRMAFGAGDYTLDLDMAWTRDEAELAHARATVVQASRAAGWDAPVDTVWVDLGDAEGMAASAARVRRMGFGGKLCIHPNQLAPANAVFLPGEAELARARTVVAAFDEAERTGSASIQVDGGFVDYPVVQRARRIVAAAEAWSRP